MDRLAVMYHYVRPDGDVPTGIRPLRLADFERQLDGLARRHGIVGPDAYVAGEGGCLLTFDDGTRDHADVVLPVLAERGLTGVFFVLTGPWEDGRLPTAHRVHALLSREAPERLLASLAAAAADRGLDLGSPAEAARVYHYEDEPARAQVKYALNFALPAAAAEAILDELVPALLGDERALVEEWLLSPEDAARLRRHGMTVAAHGHRHEALARLDADGVEAEIRTCHERLSALLGEEPRWFAPPFGGAGAPAETLARMEAVLLELGYAGYCTTEPGGPSRARGLWRIGRVDAVAL
jgi:peptidoglycan/xylan/chitin deacetylase (PgdA/CDA1 family)